MSRQVNYTGEHIPDAYVAGYDPNLTAISILRNRQIPDNFVNLSSKSKAYKENVLGQLLLQVQDHDALLDTVCSFMRSAPDGSITLQVMTEYAASIAFALEHKDLAIQMITRNEPTHVSPHIWSLVNAIKKGMPGVMYQGLLTSNVHIASVEWEATKETVINTL